MKKTSPIANPANFNISVRSPMIGRWMLAGVLLLAEYFYISLNFDAAPLRQLSDLKAAFGYLDTVAPLLVAVATAILLLGGSGLTRGLDQLVDNRPHYRSWPFLIAHLGFFALFVSVTNVFLNTSIPSDGALYGWFAAWSGVGVLAVLLLLAAVVPLGALWSYGCRTNALLIAGCAVGITAWAAGLASEELWTPLNDLTLSTVKWLLSWFTADIQYDPAIALVGTAVFSVEVAPACSGYEGIGLILIFILAYAWWDRRTLSLNRVLLLLPAAVFLAWIANAVRITALIAIGTWGSADLALQGFHTKAGWVLFCAIALGFVAVTRHSNFFCKNSVSTQDTWNPTAAYLMPLLALLATALAAGLFITEFNFLYPAQVLAASAALVAYRRYFTPRWSWSWPAATIGILVFAFWIALEPEPDSAAMAAWREELYKLPLWLMGLWLACRIIGSVIIVPIVEELAFRGYLLRRLVSSDFIEVPTNRLFLLPLLVSSLMFGVLHQNYLAGVLAGVFYAIAQIHRGRLSDAILAHAITNGLIAVYILGTGSWNLWM